MRVTDTMVKFLRTPLVLLVLLVSGPVSFGQVLSSTDGKMPDIVPLFELQDVNGNLVSLEAHRGKVVMINFWATWCPPCIEEMPAMDALKKALSDKPFEILAVNISEDREAIETFLERTGFDLNFPLLLDPGGIVADKYAVRGLPATMLVDPDGKFAFGGVGARDWDSPEVIAEIMPLFD